MRLITTPITESFANARIVTALRALPDKRARMGLAKLDGRLARERVAPGLRLHLIAAVKQLSIDSARTRQERVLRAGASHAREGPR